MLSKFQGIKIYGGPGLEEFCRWNEWASDNNALEVQVELFIALEEICTKVVQVIVDEPWIIDSGALCHMTSHKDWYTSLHPVENDILIAIDNVVKCPMKGKSTIALKSNGVVH